MLGQMGTTLQGYLAPEVPPPAPKAEQRSLPVTKALCLTALLLLFFCLETRPDSPGEPGMKPRDPCLPWRGK